MTTNIEHGADKGVDIGNYISPSESMLLGILLGKIEYWTKQYEFSFQFWGEDNNNVYIMRDDVEIGCLGGRTTVTELLEDTIEWCEKANPRFKYTSGLTVTNPQP